MNQIKKKDQHHRNLSLFQTLIIDANSVIKKLKMLKDFSKIVKIVIKNITFFVLI